MAFNSSTYLQNKAAQMNRTSEKGRTDWTVSDVQKAFDKANLTAQQHYNRYGVKEGISPGSGSGASVAGAKKVPASPASSATSSQGSNSGFNSGIYTQNKVAQLNKSASQGRTDWTVEDVEKAFADSGLTAQQHYNRYGVLEGVTPYATRPAADVPTTSVSSDQTASGQLKGLLSSDSALMQRAATKGAQLANQRGLLNSSMAAGAAQGAMIDRATPIASQDAQAYYNNNQANAQRGQQAYMANLQNQNQMRLNEQQYGFQTGLNDQRFGFDQALNRQQADLDMNRLRATSTANAWGETANNVTDIVAQGMEGIANIQANPNIKPEDKTAMIEQILAMRDADIEFQTQLYGGLDSDLADLINNLPFR